MNCEHHYSVYHIFGYSVAISMCICRIETLQKHDGHYNKNVKSLFFISQNFAVHEFLCKTMMSQNLSHEKRRQPTLEIFFSFVDMNAFCY